MGGGSSINGGTALRGTLADSKEWVALGNEAWDFDSVYRVYQSLEDDEVRGTKRTASHCPESQSTTQARFRKFSSNGAQECGFPFVLDLNATGACRRWAIAGVSTGRRPCQRGQCLHRPHPTPTESRHPLGVSRWTE